jgi:septum site-determining protein MinD
MTRVIGLISGKGGVGKTTLTSNLAYSLTELGKGVTVIDTNLTTPHLGFHLGMHLAPKTLHDVLSGRIKVRDATYSHPHGFKIVPGSISINDLVDVDTDKLREVTSSFIDKTDFVILDSAPGLGKEAISTLQAADEVLLITNPDLPSVVDALKTLKMAQTLNKKVLGVVLNRVKGTSHELTSEEIEKMLEAPVLSEIPEDPKVPQSIAAKWPVVDYFADSPASVEFRRLAYSLCGIPFEYKRLGILDRLIKWLMK